MGRARYLLLRAVIACGVVVAVSAITHGLLRITRPDVFSDGRSVLGGVARYVTDGFLHLDFGRAFTSAPPNEPVLDVVLRALPVDLALLAGALPLGVLLGVTAGVICAARPRTPVARVLEVLIAVGLVAPVYWLGLMGILLFAPGIDAPFELPGFSIPNSYEPFTVDPGAWFGAMLTPWLVLSVPTAALCARMMRSAMTEVLGEDYLRTALAKGLRERTVLRRHAVPAAAGPVATIAGIYMTTVASNALLVEQVFGLPGALRGTLRASQVGDFALLQGLVVVTSALVVFGVFLADAVGGWLDPRIRHYASSRTPR